MFSKYKAHKTIIDGISFSSLEEVWLDINGFNGLYQISNKGRVRTFRNGRFGIKKEPKILKTQINMNGYEKIELNYMKVKNNFRIHRIVGEHFIENKDNLYCINHKNGVKTDNRVENLEWTTSSYNNKHAYMEGLKKSLKGKCNKLSRQICQYDKKGNIIKIWKGICSASEELGIKRTTISACCRGRQRTSGGFIWKYN